MICEADFTMFSYEPFLVMLNEAVDCTFYRPSSSRIYLTVDLMDLFFNILIYISSPFPSYSNGPGDRI